MAPKSSVTTTNDATKAAACSIHSGVGSSGWKYCPMVVMKTLATSETRNRHPAAITTSEEYKRCLMKARTLPNQVGASGSVMPQIRLSAECSSTTTEDAPTTSVATLRMVAIRLLDGR